MNTEALKKKLHQPTALRAPTGDLDRPVRPVVLQVRFVQVIQEVVFWIVVVIGLL